MKQMGHKRKIKAERTIKKYKARLVNGFKQLGVGHHVINKLEIHQLDLKTTFLNGQCSTIQWFIVKGSENKIYKLVKSSYNLT